MSSENCQQALTMKALSRIIKLSQVEAFIPKEFANYTHTLTQRKSLIVLTILEESVDPMLLVNT